MGFYSYEVVDRMGRPGSGQMAADDEMIVAKKLRDLGLTVLDINEVRQSFFRTLFKRKPKMGSDEAGDYIGGRDNAGDRLK
jgi:type II secretory pathway component PulF